MFFAGIDLAWSERNRSGIAIINGQKDAADFVSGTNDIHKNNEIVDYIISHIKGDPALIAIDASLIVNNTTGERKAETLLKKMFAPFHAVPYPSNRKPSLNLPSHHHIVKTNVRTLKGKALKQYEDLLDAVFCAYIAFYYWYDPGKCSVIGNLNEGYIVSPVFRNPPIT